MEQFSLLPSQGFRVFKSDGGRIAFAALVSIHPRPPTVLEMVLAVVLLGSVASQKRCATGSAPANLVKIVSTLYARELRYELSSCQSGERRA